MQQIWKIYIDAIRAIIARIWKPNMHCWDRSEWQIQHKAILAALKSLQ